MRTNVVDPQVLRKAGPHPHEEKSRACDARDHTAGRNDLFSQHEIPIAALRLYNDVCGDIPQDWAYVGLTGHVVKDRDAPVSTQLSTLRHYRSPSL
jgi:hypothetical protein